MKALSQAIYKNSEKSQNYEEVRAPRVSRRAQEREVCGVETEVGTAVRSQTGPVVLSQSKKISVCQYFIVIASSIDSRTACRPMAGDSHRPFS
jgi:hypothetical protein